MKDGELIAWRRKTNLLIGELSHQKRRYSEERRMFKDAEKETQCQAESLKLVQQVAEIIQNQAHEQIARTVTTCIQTVFQDKTEFKISFSKARGKTEARLSFANGDKEESPLEASSGGKVDVASFALRLVSILLSRPQRRRLLVLDEPFRFVHGEEYRERTRALVEEMAGKMDFQVIMSTGLRWLQTGNIIDVSKT